jgi:hypothetical protein
MIDYCTDVQLRMHDYSTASYQIYEFLEEV